MDARQQELVTAFGEPTAARGASGVEERAARLVQAEAELSSAAFVGAVEECYRTGDNSEKCAVLRALPKFADARRFVLLAVEACRTNVVPVFEAIACENPFPAHHFPEANLNQLVVKALFLGVSLRRIFGLETRVTPELLRMVEDFAAERHAAGRVVPDDVGWLLDRAQGKKGKTP